ncbi:MAG: response regulator [bacterium]|nr:response regulator [bacterium]
MVDLEWTRRLRHPIWRDPAWKLMLGLLLGVTVAVLATAFSISPYYVTWHVGLAVLLVGSIWAVHYRRRELESAVERRFWLYITVAQGIWLLALVMQYYSPARELPFFAVLNDFVFLSWYLAYLFAADSHPERGPSDPQRRLNLVGAILFAFGLLVYFLLIPSYLTKDPHAVSLPSSFFYIGMDCYLAFRFYHEGRHCRRRRWRTTFRLLTLTTGCWLLTDVLVALSRLPDSWVYLGETSALDLLWYLWAIPLTLAARLRHVESRDEPLRPGAEIPRDSEPLRTRYWISLVLYAFLLPFLHLLLYSLGWRIAELQQARDLAILIYILLLGFLVFQQQRIQEARARTLESERRRSEEALRAQEAAEAADRAKTEFLSLMSHEIRTPMNGVIGMCSLLLGTPLSGDQRKYVETVRVSGETLLTLLNDILDFSHLESGRFDLEPAVFSLRSCVRETLDLMAPAAREKDLKLNLRIDDDVPETLVGDVTRVRQILANLLSNAVKFTEKGEVSVGVRIRRTGTDRCELHFAVRDTGIGIAPEGLTRLFQPFSQVDSSTTRQYGGTGLGLIICKRLSELMGGRIWAESRAGEGSTFHFTILTELAPAEAGEAAHSERPVIRPQSEPSDTLSRKLRILLAEDNAVSQKVALMMLRRLGYQADVAANGFEVLDAVHRQPYDVVLMDVQMPEMDGLTATREICRELAGDERPRIIGMTANAMRDDRERCLAAGMDEYLSKPVQIADLQSVLKAIRLQ